jgi:NAD(P)-dependent dehydrogenase (short-subunit alcohol dehydrogenase family)
MLARGGGSLMITASAAGLLTELDSAPYAVTKHAAVALAEWLAITYGDQGLKVSCLCPQAIRTNLGATSRKQTGEAEPPPEVSQGSAFWQAAVDGVLTADQAAQTILEGLADERFLILPHPEVAVYEQRRAQDRDRWLRGMRRFRARLFSTPPPGGEQGA